MARCCRLAGRRLLATTLNAFHDNWRPSGGTASAAYTASILDRACSSLDKSGIIHYQSMHRAFQTATACKLGEDRSYHQGPSLQKAPLEPSSEDEKGSVLNRYFKYRVPTARSINQVLKDMPKNSVYAAWSLYHEMSQEGIDPDSHTFIHLMGIARKDRHLQFCYWWFLEMLKMGLSPSPIHYNILIAACGNARQFGLAQQTLKDMADKGLVPDAHTYKGFLGACEKAGAYVEAQIMLKQMETDGTEITPFMYLLALKAHSNHARQLWRSVRFHGSRPPVQADLDSLAHAAQSLYEAGSSRGTGRSLLTPTKQAEAGEADDEESGAAAWDWDHPWGSERLAGELLMGLVQLGMHDRVLETYESLLSREEKWGLETAPYCLLAVVHNHMYHASGYFWEARNMGPILRRGVRGGSPAGEQESTALTPGRQDSTGASQALLNIESWRKMEECLDELMTSSMPIPHDTAVEMVSVAYYLLQHPGLPELMAGKSPLNLFEAPYKALHHILRPRDRDPPFMAVKDLVRMLTQTSRAAPTSMAKLPNLLWDTLMDVRKIPTPEAALAYKRFLQKLDSPDEERIAQASHFASLKPNGRQMDWVRRRPAEMAKQDSSQ